MEKQRLLMATLNSHKFDEARDILRQEGLLRAIELKNLADTGFHGEIPEEGDTLEKNASFKSHHVYALYGTDCFADDTGLEVYTLGGIPGVYSARFAGPEADSGKNITKLLHLMKKSNDRRARFRTVISLIIKGKEYMFEGVVEGEILSHTEGGAGFGYDPVFRPTGYDSTFASMTTGEKNRISHRYQALRKMSSFLLLNHGLLYETGNKIGK